jgi:hypothetical protein
MRLRSFVMPILATGIIMDITEIVSLISVAMNSARRGRVSRKPIAPVLMPQRTYRRTPPLPSDNTLRAAFLPGRPYGSGPGL